MDLKQELINILANNTNTNNNKNNKIIITNKKRRLLKNIFNKRINLTDKMFQGYHVDNSIIGSYNNDELEINMIADVFRKTPAISLRKALRTVYTWKQEMDSHEREYIIRNYGIKKYIIIMGAERYNEMIRENRAKVKTRGLDLSREIYNMFINKDNNNDKEILEKKIIENYKNLETYIKPLFTEDFTFNDFRQKIILCIDRSGSMNGNPIEIGLLYMLYMVKLFKITELFYFESSLEIRKLTEEEIENSSFIELVNKIYTKTLGGTVIDNFLLEMNRRQIKNKNIIIITDGDCDPIDNKTTSPFHEVFKENGRYNYIKNTTFTIINTKTEKLDFPYLNTDKGVCYLSGNNPKNISAFIKAIYISSKNNILITPSLVLHCCMELPELIIPFPIHNSNSNSNSLINDNIIKQMFNAYSNNLPKKIIKYHNIDNIDNIDNNNNDNIDYIDSDTDENIVNDNNNDNDNNDNNDNNEMYEYTE
jgi:hypothetical protein